MDLHGKLIGIQPEPVKENVNIFFQIVSLPAGRFDIFIPVPACNKSFVSGVKISDECCKGCPDIMGKAGHKLTVCLLCLPHRRKPAFIGHNDLIDLIGNGGCQLICRGQDPAAAISVFHVSQSVCDLRDLLFHPPDAVPGGQDCQSRGHNGQKNKDPHTNYTSLLKR